MKNKKMLYILIPLTFLIWGTIIYKVYSAMHGDEDLPLVSSQELAMDSNSETVKDTFSINPNYRDPFFGKVVTSEKKSSSTNTTIKPKVTPLISQWPAISYFGLVKNQKSNKQLVLVQINGQSNSIKIGDVVNGIELTKVFRDSIEVKWGKEKKFVRK